MILGQARVVQMDRMSVFVSRLGRRLQALQGLHAAAHGVFQTEQTGGGIMRIVGFGGGFHLVGVEPAVAVGRDGAGNDAAQGRAADRFGRENVIARARDEFLATLAVAQHGRVVGLDVVGLEDSRLLAEKFRRVGFQRIHRRVVAIDIVAHLRVHHGFTHGRVGVGDGIAAQIDRARFVGAWVRRGVIGGTLVMA